MKVHNKQLEYLIAKKKKCHYVSVHMHFLWPARIGTARHALRHIVLTSFRVEIHFKDNLKQGA